MNSLSVSFLIFGVSLLLFHIPVAWVWFRKDHLPANPKSWKKKWELTDYLWLGLCTLSVITAANEVTKMFSRGEIAGLLPYSGVSGVVEHAQTFRDSALRCRDPRKDEVVAWFNDGIEAANVGDPLLEEAKQLLADGKGNDALQKLEEASAVYQGFLNKHKAISDDMPAAYDARITRRGVKDRYQQTVRLKAAYLRTQQGEVEATLVVLSPALLAIGLAIRFAKVSSRVLIDV